MAPVSFDTFLKQWRSGGQARADAAQTTGLSPESSIIRGPANTLIEVVPAPDTIAYDRAQEAERRRALAELEARAAEDERAAATIKPVESRDPPAAADLKVSVLGLQPARAKLARFLAWEAQIKADLETAKQGRAAYVAQLGVTAVTQQALDDLVGTDRSGLLAWMRSGGRDLAPTAREYEQAALRDKLSADTAQAAVARQAIEALDSEINVLEQQVAVLGRRRASFVAAALVEMAEPMKHEYEAAAEVATAAVARLAGLTAALRDISEPTDIHWWRAPGAPGSYDARMPSFRFARDTAEVEPRIRVNQSQVDAEAKPWRAIAETLAKDPRARVTVPKGARR